jgi:hypothetical protein
MAGFNRIRNFALGYAATVGGIGCSIMFYTRRIDQVPPTEYPKPFQVLIHEHPAALYHRRLNEQVFGFKSLEDTSKVLFSQPFYHLELAISDTKFDPESFHLREGEKIGHMVVESVKDNQCVFRYLYENYNYRLFLQCDRQDIKLGFVEYSGSKLEDIGCRIYVPLLLEGLVKRLEQQD